MSADKLLRIVTYYFRMSRRTLIPSRKRNIKEEIERQKQDQERQEREAKIAQEERKVQEDKDYKIFHDNFGKREKYCSHFEGQQYTDHIAQGTRMIKYNLPKKSEL